MLFVIIVSDVARKSNGIHHVAILFIDKMFVFVVFKFYLSSFKSFHKLETSFHIYVR